MAGTELMCQGCDDMAEYERTVDKLLALSLNADNRAWLGALLTTVSLRVPDAIQGHD